MTLLWIGVGIVIGAGLRSIVKRRPGGTGDALTGVPTRGTGQQAIDSLRPGDAVAIIDLDGLKLTNDTHGHAAGDKELIALARHLSEGVRQEDTVARWGGDEFVMVLRGGGAAASAVVDRLRADSPTGFSAGIAVHSGGPGADTLAAADAALLRAKRAGGSQVATA